MLRVCVTGPESTGKTTLAEALAARAGTAMSPEASRRYAEAKGSPLDAGDVTPIARAQMALDEGAVAAARDRGARIVVLDTDLWSTVVYARHYYGDVPAEVLEAARRRGSDLYLLCDVDVPWVADGIRDSPDNREAMFTAFHDTLVAEGIAPVVVRGSWDDRWRIATRAVDALTG